MFSRRATTLLVVAVFPIRRLLAPCSAARVLRDLRKFIAGQHTRSGLKIIKGHAVWITLFVPLIAGVPSTVHADDAAPLRACLLANNLPYSSRSDANGFDFDTARAVARILERPLEPVWTANATDIEEIEDSNFPVRKLARGECDVIFSMPGPAAETLGSDQTLVLGEVYYGAGFELIGCSAELPSRLRGLRGHTVAIQSQTIAHFALLMVQAKPQTYFTVGAALKGIANGEADAGLLWGPAAGWRIQQAMVDGCSLVSGYTPPAAVRWNLHAATREVDAELRLRIDAALLDLSTTTRLREIGARYGIPVRTPFESTYTMGALNALQWERE